MFVEICYSIHSIASCSFGSILMPESSLQECYVMLICWNCYNMLICHFCHVWCVHCMRLMSTRVLNYAMSSLHRCLPCTFVINVVTSTSMQSSLRDIADFRLLRFCQVFCLLLFLCHVNLMLQRDPCIFWDTSVRVLWTCGYCLSIHALCYNYGVV